MKIWTIALSTLESFLHNRLLVVILLLAFGITLLMLTPMLAIRQMAATDGPISAEGMALSYISGIISFLSALGTLLAAWAAADSYNAELKSGTVLAVMSRPITRWQFLLGKYCGVLLLMAFYVLVMFGMSYLLAAIAGEHIHAPTWVLLVYPLVRYAIWAALALLAATYVSTLITMALIILVGILMTMTSPSAERWKHPLDWLQQGLHYLLPSTGLLTESRYLAFTQASLKPTPLLQQLTAVAYGAEYALILLLLAMWSFHYRTLRRD